MRFPGFGMRGVGTKTGQGSRTGSRTQATPDNTSPAHVTPLCLPRVLRAVDHIQSRFTMSTPDRVGQTGFAVTDPRCSPGPSRAVGVIGVLPGSISRPSDLPPIPDTWGASVLQLTRAHANPGHQALCPPASAKGRPAPPAGGAAERGPLCEPQADPHLCPRRLWQDHASQRMGRCL